MLKLPPSSMGWAKGLFVGFVSMGSAQLFVLPFGDSGIAVKVLAAALGAGLGAWLAMRVILSNGGVQEKNKRDL
jgi:hypothetical protein